MSSVKGTAEALEPWVAAFEPVMKSHTLSFRGAGAAREPGIQEHGPIKAWESWCSWVPDLALRMGTFNETVNASDGFGSRFTIGSFILTDVSGSWLSPSQVLTANTGGGNCPFPPGCDAAAHVAPLSQNGNVTGFVGELAPAPVIGHGLFVLLAVGGVLSGSKLLERIKKHRSLGTGLPHAAA